MYYSREDRVRLTIRKILVQEACGVFKVRYTEGKEPSLPAC